jgi:phosphinothricin acetyltransferase
LFKQNNLTNIIIRDANKNDLAAIQYIYAYHVSFGLASFEEVPPDIKEISRRLSTAKEQNLPYLVAEYNGEIQGFSYVSPFRKRIAYRYVVEDSVYVSENILRLGIGSNLLSSLIDRCTVLGFRQMIAVIGDSANKASVGLHAKHGFVQTGSMPAVGFKFGRWVDSIRMQRPLGDGDKTLPK